MHEGGTRARSLRASPRGGEFLVPEQRRTFRLPPFRPLPIQCSVLRFRRAPCRCEPVFSVNSRTSCEVVGEGGFSSSAARRSRQGSLTVEKAALRPRRRSRWPSAILPLPPA